MALVPHKITALAESDAQGTDGKNIVAGAVVALFNIDDEAVILYDDENGTNGSTAKQTDSKGQVVVYVDEGEYDEQVNGATKRRVLIGSKNGSITSYATTAEIEALRPNKTGDRIENRERANAQYTLAAEGYTAQAGDVVAANGRVWELQLENNTVFAEWFGAKFDGSADDTSAIQAALDFGKKIIFPVGVANVSETLQIRDSSKVVVGQGRGSGAQSNSSLYKQSNTILNWVGASNKPVIKLNDGGAAIKWGVQLSDFSIYGNFVSGVDAITSDGKCAGAIYTNIEMQGVRHGLTLGFDDYSCRMYNVGCYEYTGWGMRLIDNNHNALFSGCQFNYCLTTSPEGCVVVEGDPTGLAFVGCDFEPFNAQTFVWLKNASAVSFDGCYFEARDANTQNMIKFGETVVSGNDVKSASVNGCTFQGAGVGREAFMIQNKSSGLVFEGNHIIGFTNSVVNNSDAGVNNRIGVNWISSTPTVFVGGNSGFTKRTRAELTSNTAAITVNTGILSVTHKQQGFANTRKITATIYAEAEDSSASNVSANFVIQKFTGSSWSDLGQFAKLKSFVNTGSRAIISGTVNLSEIDENADTMFTNTQYRVEVRPSTNDSVIVLAGSSVEVKEI